MRPIGFKVINNEAYIHEYKLSDLAKEYKTPLYVMDEQEILERISDYKEGLKSDKFSSSIVYASKAFLTTEFCKLIDQNGLFMDAVSLGDLYVINQANFPLSKVVFHGNNKSIDELEFAIKNKIGYLVIDNLYELEQIIEITNNLKEEVNCLIRVNPGINAHTHKYIQTALYTSKFGESIYDLDTIDKMMKIITSSNYIKLYGFHAHIGSQIHEKNAFILEVDKMVDFQNKVMNDYNVILPVLNLGGGFGIKYEYEEKAIPTKEVCSSLKNKLEDKLKETSSLINHIMIEPGRSIVGNAGMTLYTCSQIKPTFGKKNYLFIDGGMTDNIRPSLYGATYECDVVNKMNNPKNVLVDIAGKCCESGDLIRTDVLIPKIDHNDVLVVYSTGAYNCSMFSNYNNMLKPAVLLVGKEIKILSKRENLVDLTRLF